MPKYIDADVLHAEVCKIGGHLYSDWDTAGVFALIDRQPAADVALVVHARWECQAYWDSTESGEPSPRCSACHETNLVEKPYCPNCGAIMDL